MNWASIASCVHIAATVLSKMYVGEIMKIVLDFAVYLYVQFQRQKPVSILII